MFLTVVFLAGLACQFLPGTSACRVSRRFCSMTTPRCTGAAVVNQVKNRINGLRKNDGSKLFRLDNKFLCRLAWVESKYGEDPNTFRRGYYGGIWQVMSLKSLVGRIAYQTFDLFHVLSLCAALNCLTQRKSELSSLLNYPLRPLALYYMYIVQPLWQVSYTSYTPWLNTNCFL